MPPEKYTIGNGRLFAEESRQFPSLVDDQGKHATLVL